MVKFPEHKASLSLEHNDHKSSYETVEEYVAWLNAEDSFVNEEQKQKAYKTQDLWVLQWYPDTPVGFCLLMAADLDVLLEAAGKI